MGVTFRYDFWANEPEEDGPISLNCFLPNGNLIILSTSKQNTLQEMKEVRHFGVFTVFFTIE